MANTKKPHWHSRRERVTARRETVLPPMLAPVITVQPRLRSMSTGVNASPRASRSAATWGWRSPRRTARPSLRSTGRIQPCRRASRALARIRSRRPSASILERNTPRSAISRPVSARRTSSSRASSRTASTRRRSSRAGRSAPEAARICASTAAFSRRRAGRSG